MWAGIRVVLVNVFTAAVKLLTKHHVEYLHRRLFMSRCQSWHRGLPSIKIILIHKAMMNTLCHFTVTDYPGRLLRSPIVDLALAASEPLQGRRVMPKSNLARIDEPKKRPDDVAATIKDDNGTMRPCAFVAPFLRWRPVRLPLLEWTSSGNEWIVNDVWVTMPRQFFAATARTVHANRR